MDSGGVCAGVCRGEGEEEKREGTKCIMFMPTIVNGTANSQYKGTYIHKLIAGVHRHMKRDVTHTYVQCASIVHTTHTTYKYDM